MTETDAQPSKARPVPVVRDDGGALPLPEGARGADEAPLRRSSLEERANSVLVFLDELAPRLERIARAVRPILREPPRARARRLRPPR